MKQYPKLVYEINPQPLTVDADYEKVQMKYDFGNKYEYFSEYIDENFPEYILGELDVHVFVHANHGQYKVTGRSITGLFPVVASKTTT